MPVAKCSFGMIHLSRHSVDRSPRALHSSTHNAMRASCFEVLSASVESIKPVSGWKPVLGRAFAIAWMFRIIFLEAAICVVGKLSSYVGEGLSLPVHAGMIKG